MLCLRHAVQGGQRGHILPASSSSLLAKIFVRHSDEEIDLLLLSHQAICGEQIIRRRTREKIHGGIDVALVVLQAARFNPITITAQVVNTRRAISGNIAPPFG